MFSVERSKPPAVALANHWKWVLSFFFPTLFLCGIWIPGWPELPIHAKLYDYIFKASSVVAVFCMFLVFFVIFRFINRLSQAIRVSTLGPVLCYDLLIFPITACDLGVALFEGMLCFAPSPSSSNRVGCWWARGWQCTFGMWCLVKPCDCLDDSVMCDCRFSWRFKTLRPDTCDIMSLARSGRREGVRSNPSLGRLPGWRHSCFFFGGGFFWGVWEQIN